VLLIVSGGALIGVKLMLDRYDQAVPRASLLDDSARATTRTDTQARASVSGPLDILMLGIDPRPENPNEAPHVDTIMIMHVAQELDRAQVFSIARDTVVDIPAFPPAHYRGGRDRITNAMAYGSVVPGSPKPSREQGARLISKIVTKLTGLSFDAAAIVDFSGFERVVEALGGVHMCVDVRTVSQHRTKDNKIHVYEPGCRHMEAWQALDYVRQRKSLDDFDYGRIRHQQDFIKAIMKQATSAGVITNPAKLDAVLRAGAGALTVDLQPGQQIGDWAFSLRNLKSDRVTLLKVPGHAVGGDGSYQGEDLDPIAWKVFAAVRDSTVEELLREHPELENKPERGTG